MSIPTSPWVATGPARVLGDELRPGSPERERSGEPPDAAWRRLTAAGLADTLIDRAVGGGGGSLTRAAEEVAGLGAGDLVGALLLAGHHSAVGILRLAGPAAPALQERVVREGRRLSPALAGAEPLEIASRDDGARALTGAAAEVHGAGVALGYVAVARGGAPAPLVALVPADRPGVVVEDLTLRAGLRRLPAGRAQFLGAVLDDGEVAPVGEAFPDPAAIARALRAVLEGAAVVGAARGSVEASAALTRARKQPRPVPGATSAIADPIGQVVIGEALGPIDAAHALVLEVAGELDAALAAGAPADPAALSVRALAAIDIALGVALEQGERVYELVGTSGSGNVHGFDALWRDVRTLSLAWPRAERRRAVGRAFLEAR